MTIFSIALFILVAMTAINLIIATASKGGRGRRIAIAMASFNGMGAAMASALVFG